MKKTSLMLTVVLGLFLLLTIATVKAEAQSGFAGRWTQEGVGGVSLIISSISGNYTAVYVMGQMTCRFNNVSISGNNIHMTGRYNSGEGFVTDLDFNLTLSDDGITLSGTKGSDTHWTNRRGQPLHHVDNDPVIFTR